MTRRGVDAWAFAGLGAQAEALRSGQVSSVELVGAALARAESTQGSLNAFRLIRAGDALREAADADGRLRGGEDHQARREPLPRCAAVRGAGSGPP
ncbi:MAG: hypothetical protein ACR2KC_07765 [Acidimicrobiales bacterium]